MPYLKLSPLTSDFGGCRVAFLEAPSIRFLRLYTMKHANRHATTMTEPPDIAEYHKLVCQVGISTSEEEKHETLDVMYLLLRHLPAATTTAELVVSATKVT